LLHMLTKKRILVTLFFFSLALYGCNGKEKTISKNEIMCLSGINLTPFVDSVLDLYIETIPNAPCYGLFFDKKTSGFNEYVIAIAPFYEDVNNLYKSGAVNYLYHKSDKYVFSYSGIEDL